MVGAAVLVLGLLVSLGTGYSGSSDANRVGNSIFVVALLIAAPLLMIGAVLWAVGSAQSRQRLRLDQR